MYKPVLVFVLTVHRHKRTFLEKLCKITHADSILLERMGKIISDGKMTCHLHSCIVYKASFYDDEIFLPEMFALLVISGPTANMWHCPFIMKPGEAHI